jgi:2-(1,2-epoxy-1,2-dihydrophenyl)acetyl-CoA isomerase
VPDPTVRSEVAERIATITLDRPDVLNAFDRALKEELLAALKQAARDRDVRVVVVTGAGRAFSAGQDLRERLPAARKDGTAAETDTDAGTAARLAAPTPLDQELRERYNPIVLAIRTMDKPVIAAVNGVAAGAGMSLALACDMRIASEAASFIEVFGRVGLVPDTGSTWFLPRLIGPAKALELMWTTDSVDAPTALALGIVNRVVAPDQLMSETRALAVRLASAAPLALALAKRAVNRALEIGLPEALDYEASLQGIAGRSLDHAEGVRAFIEKRTARFTGE